MTRARANRIERAPASGMIEGAVCGSRSAIWDGYGDYEGGQRVRCSYVVINGMWLELV
jgi:hypothetical protein